MGVKGLWRLLLPVGRRISVETLEGRVVAVDASIWLTQFLKAMRDPETGKMEASAHLKGFFRRLCRLRYHGIRPVVVFDGAAPEIKRRELTKRRRRREPFAAPGGADIRRLARKILAENLKKSRNSGGPPVAAAATTTTTTTTTAASFDPGFNVGGDEEEGQRGTEQQPEEKTDVEGGFATSRALLDSDSVAGAGANDENSEEENDWDEDPTSRAGEAKGGSKNSNLSEDDEDERHNENGGGDDDDDDEVFDHAAQLYDDDGEFDVDLMANLPASKRKDAVERAQRRRRMESRKDFMPAAADPLRFSNVQLSNFLKTCKLNRDIASAAKKAAKKDNLHDAMASDRATLVELIREEDDNANPDDGKQYDARDEDGNNGMASDTLKDSLTLVDPAPRTPDEERKSRRRVKRLSERQEDSDDDVFCDDGPSPSAAKKLHSGSAILDDDCESVDDQPGGFFPEPPFEAGGVAAAAELEGPNTQAKVAAAPALSEQEALDYELAVALQEAENDGREAAPELSRPCSYSRPDVIDLSFSGDDESAGGRDSRKASNRSFSSKVASRSFNDSPSLGAESHLSTEKDNASESPTIESRAGPRNDDRAARSRDGLLQKGIAESTHLEERAVEVGATRSHEHAGPSGEDDDDEGDDVDWEDGVSECHTATRSESRSASPALNHQEDDWNAAPWPSSSVDATAAALERGLSTASRLTNWAGVAFRRAMQASGQVAPNSPGDGKKEASEQVGDAHNEATDETISSHGDASPDMASVQPFLKSTPTAQVDKRSDTESEDLDFQQTAAGEVSNSEAFHVDDDDIQRWTRERNSRERDMETITDDMREEVMHLLQLFGVPYIEAPAEAEAQCVELEKLGLVHGIVTEDSDVFVFGGKTVYKNIFEEQKYAEEYRADDAARILRLGRNEFVALAMLLGGDYTEGVRGVGIVNGMEILEAFTMVEGTKVGLLKFKEWLDGICLEEVVCDGSEEALRLKHFHEKHRTARTSWTTPDGFPAENVIHAYLNPVVDKSEERFTWGRPDVEKLIHFCQQYVGWSPNETKKYLDPVMEKLESGLRQTRLDSYMKYEDSIQFADVRSKRLRRVLGLSLPGTGQEGEDASTSSKRRRHNTGDSN